MEGMKKRKEKERGRRKILFFWVPTMPFTLFQTPLHVAHKKI
jgi:hypothetical protein